MYSDGIGRIESAYLFVPEPMDVNYREKPASFGQANLSHFADVVSQVSQHFVHHVTCRVKPQHLPQSHSLVLCSLFFGFLASDEVPFCQVYLLFDSFVFSEFLGSLFGSRLVVPRFHRHEVPPLVAVIVFAQFNVRVHEIQSFLLALVDLSTAIAASLFDL